MLSGSGTTRNAGESLQGIGGSTGSLLVAASGSNTTKIGESIRLKSAEKKLRMRMPHLPETLGGSRRRDGVSATKIIKNTLFGGPLQGVQIKKGKNKKRNTIVKTVTTPINALMHKQDQLLDPNGVKDSPSLSKGLPRSSIMA